MVGHGLEDEQSRISSTIFLDTENMIKMAFWFKLFDLSYWLIEYLKVPSACLLNFTCLFQHFGRLYTRLFFCTLLKKLNHEKNSKNRVQEKNSAKFCPKTQPTAGFSLPKNYKKNSLYEKKLVFLLLKLNFSPSKLNAPQAFGLNCPTEKCTKKKPALKANFLSVLENNKAQNMAFTIKFKNYVATCQLQYLTHLWWTRCLWCWQLRPIRNYWRNVPSV